MRNISCRQGIIKDVQLIDLTVESCIPEVCTNRKGCNRSRRKHIREVLTCKALFTIDVDTHITLIIDHYHVVPGAGFQGLVGKGVVPGCTRPYHGIGRGMVTTRDHADPAVGIGIAKHHWGIVGQRGGVKPNRDSIGVIFNQVSSQLHAIATIHIQRSAYNSVSKGCFTACLVDSSTGWYT